MEDLSEAQAQADRQRGLTLVWLRMDDGDEGWSATQAPSAKDVAASNLLL
jgi:hypothetical protein